MGWIPTLVSVARRTGRTLPVLVGTGDADRLTSMTGVPVSALTGGERISDHITALATPGHTVGHFSYRIETGQQSLLVLGDVFHSGAQLHDPDITPWSDEEPDRARASRHSMLEKLQQPGVLGVAGHFADTVFGVASGNGGWEPIM